MTPEKISDYGDALFAALRERRTLPPLTDREPAITIEDAYRISQVFLQRRIAAGAGVHVQEVNRLLNEFEQMQGMMKKMKGSGMMKMMKRMGGMKGMPKMPF